VRIWSGGAGGIKFTKGTADYWSEGETLTILLKRGQEVTRGNLKLLTKAPETTRNQRSDA
jgi:hypothetical protein